MSFASATTRDARRSIRRFGESVTVTDSSGARTVTLIIEPVRGSVEPITPDVLSSHDLVHVTALSDQEDEDYGGIATPEPGMSITRTGDLRPYVWDGQSFLDAGAWEMKFSRHDAQQFGGGNWLP